MSETSLVVSGLCRLWEHGEAELSGGERQLTLWRTSSKVSREGTGNGDHLQRHLPQPPARTLLLEFLEPSKQHHQLGTSEPVECEVDLREVVQAVEGTCRGYSWGLLAASVPSRWLF